MRAAGRLIEPPCRRTRPKGMLELLIALLLGYLACRVFHGGFQQA
jgi:hypothetical protein